MATSIDPASYLSFCDLLNVDGVEFWDFPEFPEILPQDDDLFIKVGIGVKGQRVSSDEDRRIDLLSMRLYKTPQLWWVIALRNNLELVPTQVKLGDTLICPSPRYIFQEILAKRKR